MMISSYLDTERLIHSLKTALACIIGYTLTQLVDWPGEQWIVITIIIVMCAQLYVGSVIQKAYLRFFGTIAGCLFASGVILLVGTSGLTIAISIGLATFVFSYIATTQENLSYAGTLGAVTTVIILITPGPTLSNAAQRFIEISVGLLIATAVSQFIIPINARTHLRRQQAKTLSQIRDYYTNVIIKKDNETLARDLDEAIVKSLFRQRQLAAESKREFLGTKFSKEHFVQTLYAERELIRAIAFMHNAYKQMNEVTLKLHQLPAMHRFNEIIENDLTTLARAISNKKSKEHLHLPDLKGLKEGIDSLDQADQRSYLYAYYFGAELLVQSLEKIAKLCNVEVLL